MVAVGRAWLFLVAVAAMLALNVYYFATMPSAPQTASHVFSQEPCDRPVLTTRQAVWDATYGSEYPREYLGYAAWWTRLE